MARHKTRTKTQASNSAKISSRFAQMRTRAAHPIAPIVDPVSLLLSAGTILGFVEPDRPIPKRRGIRITGKGEAIEIIDFFDRKTGALVSIRIDTYPVADDGTLGPKKRADWGDVTRKINYSEDYLYDSSGRLIRITERDASGKVLRVTTQAYYSDGNIRITTTDYTTACNGQCVLTNACRLMRGSEECVNEVGKSIHVLFC